MKTDLSGSGRVALPLLGVEAQPEWKGYRPLGLAEASPEPWQPQGAYGAGEAGLTVPLVQTTGEARAELLAPAGGPDAALAAFHFGADAVYLGLKKFSARAEAENFSLAEVDEITAYAHNLAPRRRVFVTINTVIRQDELDELVEDVVHLADIGVDAIILQDLGVYRLLKEHFPTLERHASTQMSVHNRAGAEALRRLGFQRVVLARELTFEEVGDITSTAGIETEVFVHGALCYSYSGLCLFSSQSLGRSGNRGKCAYSCRDSFQVEGAPLTLRDGSEVRRDPREGFPFSMKDLALPDHMPALQAAGVSCFKIEGRKKSPLYVATTTDYYRRLLDGKLSDEERPDIEADLQTVFSRPWTRLFVQSHKDKEVADRDTVGHRGTLIGKVLAGTSLSAPQAGKRPAPRLRFRTARALERHDGLQVDLPELGKPFGFPVDRLFLVQGKTSKEVFEASAGLLVEVELPKDHPHLPEGAPIYCSSSQAVKQRYQYGRPKPGQFHRLAPLRVRGELSAAGLRLETSTIGPRGETISVVREMAGGFEAAQDAGAMEGAVRGAFSRLGQSPFELTDLEWSNPARGFVPISRLNALRREMVRELQGKREAALAERIDSLRSVVAAPSAVAAAQHTSPAGSETAKTAGPGFRWSVKVDRVGFLDGFAAEDWQDVEEVIVDIARDHPHVLEEKLAKLAQKIGRERIRLALPALTRAWEEKGLLRKIEDSLAAGWTKWEAANLSAWTYLASPEAAASPGALAPGVAPSASEATNARDTASAKQGARRTLDLATDWSIYVVNRLAALQLLDMGVNRFALSPEDGLANWRSLLAEFREQAVLVVHQDTPLFLAESCAYANLIGGCPGKANCRFESMEMVSSHGEKVTALDYHCRTIVLNQGPYCLSPYLRRLREAGALRLRADFIYRPYEADEVRRRWRLIRAGKPIAGGHAANFERGMM